MSSATTIAAPPRPIRTWDGRHHRGVKRVLELYREVDAANAELVNRGGHTVSCRPGCGSCCRQWVGTWYLEALIAAAECERTGYDLSQREVENQRDTLLLSGMTRERWFGLGNRCVFLRSDDLCGIHNARPLACRAVLVVTSPQDCASATGEIRRVENRAIMMEAYHRMLSFHSIEGITPFVAAALPVMLDLVLKGGKPSDLTKKDGVYGLTEPSRPAQAGG